MAPNDAPSMDELVYGDGGRIKINLCTYFRPGHFFNSLLQGLLESYDPPRDMPPFARVPVIPPGQECSPLFIFYQEVDIHQGSRPGDVIEDLIR